MAAGSTLLARDELALVESVKARLEGSPDLGNSRLKITIENGVVRLTGQLETLAAIIEAERLAGRVHGVLAVDNQIQLKVRRRSPAQIEARIRASFGERLALSWADISVKANREGRVVLSGKVGDARLRFAARKAAARVAGVTEIVDRIESPSAPDDLIEKSVKGLFRRGDLEGIAGDINVSVRRGTVTLTGEVPRPYDGYMATERALGVNGVRKVINRLVVRPVSYEIPVVRPHD